jgi:hypothetical protein
MKAESPCGGTWDVDDQGEPVFDHHHPDHVVSHCNRCHAVGRHHVVQTDRLNNSYPVTVCGDCWPLTFPTGVRLRDAGDDDA